MTAGTIVAATALLAQQAAAQPPWRTRRSRIRLERRSSPTPVYVWIIVAVAAVAVLAVVIGAVVVRMKRRRAPLPSQVAHVVPAARPAHTYAPYGEGQLPKHAYRPFNADDPEQGQVPPYSQGAYAGPVGYTLGDEKGTPLSSVPELSRESGSTRRDHGVA